MKCSRREILLSLASARLDSGNKSLQSFDSQFLPGPISQSEITLIAARPRNGKTLIAASIALEFAARHGMNVHYLAMTSTGFGVASRINQTAGLMLEKLPSNINGMGPAYWRQSGCKNTGVIFIDMPHPDIDRLGELLAGYGESLLHRRGLIIFDAYSLSTEAMSCRSSTLADAVTIQKIKTFAQELRMAALVFIELPYATPDHQHALPNMLDLARLGQFAANTDSTYFLHRPLLYSLAEKTYPWQDTIEVHSGRVHDDCRGFLNLEIDHDKKCVALVRPDFTGLQAVAIDV